ncbi:hypothetical protein D3C78_1630620 [compost metagenome]
MIHQVVAGDRMHQHHQPVAVQRQPGNQFGEYLRAEGQLAAPVRMRADRALVHAAHFQLEAARRLFAQGAGLLQGSGVEVHVGVVAVDMRGRVHASRVSLCSSACNQSTKRCTSRCRRLRSGSTA